MRGFRQFSAHIRKCNVCHEICTSSPLEAAPPMRFAQNTQRDTSKVLRLQRQMTMDTSKVLRLPQKLQRIFWKRCKSIAPATQNDFRPVAKNVWMSRSATPATRNEATRRLKPPKMTPFAELTIGTAIWPSRGRLRTVADGCEQLRTVRQRRANTPSTPRPPEWNGNPCYAFGENRNFCSFNFHFKPGDLYQFFGISGRGVPEDHVGGGHVGPGAICGSAESLGAAEPLLPPTGAGFRSGAQLLGGLPATVTLMVIKWGLCGDMEFI